MINKLLRGKRLTLSVVEGLDLDGKDIVKRKSFSGISQNATDDNVYSLANAIGSLMTNPVSEVDVTEYYELQQL